MPLLGSRGAASTTGFGALANLGYFLRNSLRFRASNSAYLNRTFSAGNRTLFTFSAWVKRGSLTGNQNIFGPDTNTTGSGTYGVLRFVDGTLEAFDYTNGTSNWYLATTPVYRDPAAWYHIVMAYDSAQGTSSNRVKLYVNGTQVTALGTANYPTSSYQGQWNNNLTHRLGTIQVGSSNQYFDGYMAEVNFVDGQALTPSSFGKTDAATNQWVPKKYAGTYGTNGFYLKFSDTSSTAALGTDFSGNSNTWTVNNISLTAGSTYDSMTDVPTLTNATTANYWTLNPLNPGQLGTLQSGNLEWIAGDQNNFRTIAAQVLPNSGKFYWEVQPIGGGGGGAFVSGIYIGIMNYASGGTGLFASGVRIADVGRDDYVYYSDGRKVNSNSFVSYGNSYAANDIVGIAVDIDNGKIWYSKNGTWQASGDPAAGTNAAYTTVPFSTKPFAPAMSAAEITNAQKFNFGQRPFSYTAPSGFKALNSFNLP